MVDAVSNFVLATTLLNQGPEALGDLVGAQPTLLEDDDELRGLALTATALDAHFSLDEFVQSGLGEHGDKLLLEIKHKPHNYQKIKKQIGKIVERAGKIPHQRFAELAGLARQTGLSLFAPEQTMARARAALGAAPAASPATDDLADDPRVGDAATLRFVIIHHLFDAIVGQRIGPDPFKSLLRLISMAVRGNEYAADYVKRLTDKQGVPSRSGQPPQKFHSMFQKEHIEALTAGLTRLGHESDVYPYLRDAIENLLTLRPDLFTDK